MVSKSKRINIMAISILLGIIIGGSIGIFVNYIAQGVGIGCVAGFLVGLLIFDIKKS